MEAQEFTADILISDVPYGEMVSWSGGQGHEMALFLKNLRSVLTPESVLAIISDKSQKARSPCYRRLKAFNVGKRKVEILKINAE